MNLRLATIDDSLRVLRFLVDRFHAEYADEFPPVNELKAHNYVLRAVSNGFVPMALTDDGEIAGVAIAYMDDYWWADAQRLVEGTFYVAPEYRKTRAAHLLLRGLKSIAKHLDVPLTVAVITGDQVDRKRRWLERAGLPCVGTIHHGGP